MFKVVSVLLLFTTYKSYYSRWVQRNVPRGGFIVFDGARGPIVLRPITEKITASNNRLGFGNKYENEKCV